MLEVEGLEDDLDSLAVDLLVDLERLGGAASADSLLEAYEGRHFVEWNATAKRTAFGSLGHFIH